MDPSRIEELTNRFLKLLPGGAEALAADVKKNMRAAASAAFSRMDLVTREEFDLQAALLARTRARLDALEAAVERLERGERSEPSA